MIMNMFSTGYQVCMVVLGNTELQKHAENAVLGEFHHL